MRGLHVGALAMGHGALTAATGLSAVTTRTTAVNGGCPAFDNGTFIVESYQLYPENAKFDPVRCLVYFGAIFNSTVGVFDPYTNTMLQVIDFPGLSGDIDIHLGPALADASGLLTILLDAAPPFTTGGANLTGSNILIKYDLDAGAVVWQRNLSALTENRYSGFQDVEHDKLDNIYIVGSYPGTVLRSDPAGNVAPWYLPVPEVLANTTIMGFSGLASVRERDLLLSNNNADGQIYRFDNVSTAAAGTPVLIPRTDAATGAASAPIQFSDAVLLPAKYCGTVLLVAENAVGTVVLRSRDGSWASAETLGTVSNNVSDARSGMVSAVVQVGPTNIYGVQAYFTDPLVPGTVAGNRTEFPQVDITAEIDALLAQFP